MWSCPVAERGMSLSCIVPQHPGGECRFPFQGADCESLHEGSLLIRKLLIVFFTGRYWVFQALIASELGVG